MTTKALETILGVVTDQFNCSQKRYNEFVNLHMYTTLLFDSRSLDANKHITDTKWHLLHTKKFKSLFNTLVAEEGVGVREFILLSIEMMILLEEQIKIGFYSIGYDIKEKNRQTK